MRIASVSKSLTHSESAPTLIDLRVSENTYISNYYVDASITFEDFSGVQLIENATVNVKDRDGVFPDPSTVDLGGDELGNRYHLN